MRWCNQITINFVTLYNHYILFMFRNVIFLLLLFIGGVCSIVAQEIVMVDGSTEACGGVFVDDGESANDYSNTSYLFTICPDTPGQVVRVEFTEFDLYQGNNLNNSDLLIVYDGDDAFATNLGVFTGDDLDGVLVSATDGSVTGCLTFALQITNNSSGTHAGWEGTIQCADPCNNPVSNISIIDPDTISLNVLHTCTDIPITFSSFGSQIADGFNLESYDWDFDDETILETTDIDVEHSYSEPGEYRVTQRVEDSNGCFNSNVITLQVLVSTTPRFNPIFESEICLGGISEIDNNYVEDVLWTAIPPDEVFPPVTEMQDVVGIPFLSSIIFDTFDNGQVLESVDDLISINLNMEHSYIGDLLMEIVCPDGTSVTLVENPNNGGGIFLGEAIDDDLTPEIPGVGYDYSFSPSSTNDTWNNEIAAAGYGAYTSLPAGDYSSFGNLEDLIGCPLNGEWIIRATDNLPSDNGFIFSWGITFDESILPSQTTFVPATGSAPDSIWMVAPHVISSNVDGTIIEIQPPSTGAYDIDIFALNNFGCRFDTTITVLVEDYVFLNLVDTTICQNGEAMLNGNLTGPQAAGATISWNSGQYDGDNVVVEPLTNPAPYQAQAFYGDGCYTEPSTMLVSRYEPLSMSGFSSDFICLGDSVILHGQNASGGLEPYNFVWTSSSTSVVGDTVTLSPTITTDYTVEMTDACESDPITQSFTLQLNEVIPANFTATGASGCSPIATQFQGIADDQLAIIDNAVWKFGDGATANSVNFASHTYIEPGIYDVSLTIVGTDGCVYTHKNENMVDAFNVPNAAFQPEDFNVVLPKNTFSFENLSSDNDLNFWTFDTYGTSTEENPEFQPPLDIPAEFEIQLITQNFHGCVDTTLLNVFLVNGFSLYAPTSFTPDGDGINEVWKIEGIDIDEADFQVNIYNRDGNILFQSRDIEFTWNGSSSNGSHYVQNGVYSFQILTRAKTSGDKQEITGHISILR